MTADSDSELYRMLGPVQNGASESWYREATNWLVGLATGGIAGLATYIGKESIYGPGAYLGLAAILLFGVCVAAGVILHLWHVRGHSAAERLEQCKVVPASESAAARTLRENAKVKFGNEYARSRRQRSRFHFISLTSFLFAMAVAAGALFVVARPSDKPTAPEVRDCTPSNSVAHCVYWKMSDAPSYKVLWFFPDRVVEQQWPRSSTMPASPGTIARGH